MFAMRATGAMKAPRRFPATRRYTTSFFPNRLTTYRGLLEGFRQPTMMRFVFFALLAASALSTSPTGDCESFKSMESCLAGKDFDSQGCEWCKSVAVPSSCFNATISEEFPPSIFQCDAAKEVGGDENYYYIVLALQKCQSSSVWTLHGLWPEWGQNCGKEVRGAARSEATN